MNLVKFQDTKLSQRNLLHFYTLTTKNQKRKIKETVPFTFTSKRKYLGINLPTEATLVKLCSKFSKPDFNEIPNVKLVLEMAEEPEIKFPTYSGSSKKQESSRKTSIYALLTMSKPLTVWITTNWKILQEVGIPDHLTCLLRNLYAGQEATVSTGHGTMDWFQIGKGIRQGCIVSSVYLTYMQSTSREMLGWKKHKLGSRLPGEISITSEMQVIPTLMAENEELKSLLMKVK